MREQEPSNWHALYLVGIIQRQIGLFEPSLESLAAVQRIKPDELVIKVALAETYLMLASSEVRAGFTRRAVATLAICIDTSLGIIEGEVGVRIAWKLVGDALLKLAELVVEMDESLQSVLVYLLKKLSSQDIDFKNSLLTVITVERVLEKINALPLATACLATGVLAFSLRMLLESREDDSAGSAWFDLGYALYQIRSRYSLLNLPFTLDDVSLQSIQCLRNALQKEPLNGSFWNLLGVLASEVSPKLAQHSLIRACELHTRVSQRLACHDYRRPLMPFFPCPRVPLHGAILAFSTCSRTIWSWRIRPSCEHRSSIPISHRLGLVKPL